MTTLTQCQSHYDLATPAEHPLSSTCEDLASELHTALTEAGFDVDDIEVEPDGELVLLVKVHPFPAVSIVAKSLDDMVQEWADEASYLLLKVK